MSRSSISCLFALHDEVLIGNGNTTCVKEVFALLLKFDMMKLDHCFYARES